MEKSEYPEAVKQGLEGISRAVESDIKTRATLQILKSMREKYGNSFYIKFNPQDFDYVAKINQGGRSIEFAVLPNAIQKPDGTMYTTIHEFVHIYQNLKLTNSEMEQRRSSGESSAIFTNPNGTKTNLKAPNKLELEATIVENNARQKNNSNSKPITYGEAVEDEIRSKNDKIPQDISRIISKHNRSLEEKTKILPSD